MTLNQFSILLLNMAICDSCIDVNFLTSDIIQHLRLLQLSPGPSAANLFARNLPDVSWCGGLAFDCRGDYVNDRANNSLLLVVVPDFFNGDLKHSHTRVVGRTIVDSIALVGKPRLDSRVVQPLNDLWGVISPEGTVSNRPV